jgi:hypothetical protein
MFAVPAVSACTVHTFDALAITAMRAGLLLVHTPPAAPPVAVITLVVEEEMLMFVEPAHCTTPGVGNGLTDTVVVRLQPFVHV